MNVGLHLSSETPAGKPMREQLAEMVEHTRVAEASGFDLVGMGQHYLLDNPKPQTVPTLGRVAAETDEMGLYTGVLLLPLHQPVEIAEQFTTLSNLANGVALGVGVGYIDREFRNFGISKETRGRRLEESVEIINRLWTEDDVTYEGEYYSVEDATINPKPDEKPPVWIGGQSPAAVERAARLSDAWMPSPHITLEQMRDLKGRYDEIREANGDDTAVPLFREAYVAPTTEEAYDIATETLQAKYASYLERDIDESGEGLADATTEGSTDAFRAYAEERFLVGSPEDVCAKIERYDEELGLSHILLRVRKPGLPSERVVECLELVGDEVIPNL